MAVGWILLAIGAASVAGAIAVLRRNRRIRRHRGGDAYRPGSRAEQVDQPHRHITHYRASGALPRWDP